jgi:hypothetical protein
MRLKFISAPLYSEFVMKESVKRCRRWSSLSFPMMQETESSRSSQSLLAVNTFNLGISFCNSISSGKIIRILLTAMCTAADNQKRIFPDSFCFIAFIPWEMWNTYNSTPLRLQKEEELHCSSRAQRLIKKCRKERRNQTAGS